MDSRLGAFNSGHFDGYELHDVVQLAGGKLPDRLLYSHGADDRVRSWRRDLKRDIEYSLRNGLHFEPDSRVRRAALYYPPKLEDKTRRRPFPVAYSVIPVTVPPRRFPPPWSAEEIDAYFIVRDAKGQALTYVYGEDEPGHSESRQRPAEDVSFACT